MEMWNEKELIAKLHGKVLGIPFFLIFKSLILFVSNYDATLPEKASFHCLPLQVCHIL